MEDKSTLRDKLSISTTVVVARLLVLLFAMTMFVMFNTIFDIGWAIYWDALCAIGWAGNLLLIKPLSKAFFNEL